MLINIFLFYFLLPVCGTKFVKWKGNVEIMGSGEKSEELAAQ